MSGAATIAETQAPAAPPRSHVRLILAAILAAGFVLRVAWRVHTGEHDFWTDGYRFFYELAKSVAGGHGLRNHAGDWAQRQPVYPLFLALTLLAGGNYLLAVIPEALFGVATAGFAFLIGRRFFGERAGLLAAAMAAFYPYYMVHDTALQDTSMVDLGAAAAVWVLLRARTARSPWAWLGAGALLGLIVLIRGTLLPFSLGALAWIALVGEGAPARRLLRAGAVAAACLLVLGAWMARNYELTGRAMLSSEAGAEFYWANGPYTFTFYPRVTMDRSAGAAQLALPADLRRRLAAMPETQRSDWYMAEGWTYVAAHPGQIAVGAVRKELAGFSWVLNPEREGAVEAAYMVSYIPVLILGLLGLALVRTDWREASLIWLQFAGFIVVTAVFWAHTSHRVYLDIYLMIFAAPILERIAAWGASGLSRRRSAARR